MTKEEVIKEILHRNGFNKWLWNPMAIKKTDRTRLLRVAMTRKPCDATPWAIALSEEQKEYIEETWIRDKRKKRT